MLVGRLAERSALTEVLARAAGGSSGVVQLVGEAGAGKSTLLADAVAQAVGFRVVRCTGSPAEQQIPYATLATLLRPLRGSLDQLPTGQARALLPVLGLAERAAESGLVIGMAVLELLALSAAEWPLLVVVDDLHWCDDESVRALTFAARRLAGERIAVLLSARPEGEVALASGVTVTVEGLPAEDVDALLFSTDPQITPQVRRELWQRTGGNPLAALEASRGLTTAQREGWQALPDRLPSSDLLHEYFWARTARCSDQTQSLLLLAALEGRGDLSVLAAAAASLSGDLSALDAGVAEGLVDVQGGLVAFRHPLVAAAVMHGASAEQHRIAHQALAVALADDPDRATWHEAAGCVPPNDGMAGQLAALGQRALAAAAPHAAAAAYQRAADLTSSATSRAESLAAAAEAALMAGETTRAVALATAVDLQRLAAQERGRPLLVRGLAAMRMGRADAAGPLLLDAARGLPTTDAAAAWAEAVDASLQAGDLEFGGLLLAEMDEWDLDPEDLVVGLLVARARAALSASSGAVSALLEEIAPALSALDAVDAKDPRLWNAVGQARCNVGDLVGGGAAFVAAARHARTTGDLPRLVDALAGQAFTEHALGRWSSAVAAATTGLGLLDRELAPYQQADLLLTLAEIDAARGLEEICRHRCEQVRTVNHLLSLVQVGMLAERREALLDLSLNHLPRAISRLERLHQEQVSRNVRHPYFSAIPDLVECYVRAGQPERGVDLVAEFAEVAGPAAPPTAHARYLRTKALLADQGDYEALFQESVDLDTRTGMHFLKARTLLCLGERLRRDRRRLDARVALRAAGDIFQRLEAEPWLRRVDVELAATGEVLGPRGALASRELTAQELQVAMLVAAGRRNKEVAAELFLSVRTVEFHLSKVFRKLGVDSRAALAARLSAG